MEHKGEFAMGIIGLVLAGVGGIILGIGLMLRMAANRMLVMNMGSIIMMIMMSSGSPYSSITMLFPLLMIISQGERMFNISTVITVVGVLILAVGAILALIGWIRYIQLEHGEKI